MSFFFFFKIEEAAVDICKTPHSSHLSAFCIIQWPLEGCIFLYPWTVSRVFLGLSTFQRIWKQSLSWGRECGRWARRLPPNLTPPRCQQPKHLTLALSEGKTLHLLNSPTAGGTKTWILVLTVAEIKGIALGHSWKEYIFLNCKMMGLNYKVSQCGFQFLIFYKRALI